MGASEPRLSLSAYAAAEAFKHDQTLLRAVYKAQQVQYQGKRHFIKCMTSSLEGGAVETIVYLMGSPTPIPACEVTLAAEIN